MERFMGLGTLAAGLHHEIKNPLSALSLHVQLLEERLEDHDDEEVAENLGVLKTEVTRVSGVLESFRDFASLDRLNRKTTDLPQLARQTVELVRPKAEQQRVSITLDLPKVPFPPLLADAARLEQVLLNLVVNALEGMPDGGKLTISLCCEGKEAKLNVADTGPGILESIRSRVFDPYFTTKSAGSGLGLAVCDKIVRQHGGDIDFETSATGTVFRISLPLETPR
jgi:two-component system nitrogen regulation sensor histidine kinase GlnL